MTGITNGAETAKHSGVTDCTHSFSEFRVNRSFLLSVL